MRVQHANYWLPSPESIELFENYSVTAYYLRDADGTIPEVYVYQNGEYKCTCGKAVEYVNSQFEQTDEDVAIMHKQFGYRSGYEALVKKGTGSLSRVKVIANTEPVPTQRPTALPPMLQEMEPPPVKKKINYSQLAEDDL